MVLPVELVGSRYRRCLCLGWMRARVFEMGAHPLRRESQGGSRDGSWEKDLGSLVENLLAGLIGLIGVGI